MGTLSRTGATPVPSKRVVLVGDGPEEGKRLLVEDLLGAEGFELTHLSNNTASRVENAWMQDLKFPGPRTIHADLRDPSKAAATIEEWQRAELGAGRQPLAGVVTFAEECTPITDSLARHFGLPRITDGDIAAVRDKEIEREVFRDAGLPQPQSIRCRSLEEVEKALAKIGLPAVIKPVAMATSIGVTKITADNVGNLSALYHDATSADAEDHIRANYALSSDVLIEEYVPAATEISVEGYLVNGRLRLLGPTQKHLGPEPRFEEIGHTTSADLSPELAATVGMLLERATTALKLKWTAIHAEFRIPPGGGEPVLGEIGARLGGDLIHFLWKWARGFEFPRSILSLATGVDPNLRATREGFSSIWYVRGESSLRDVSARAAEVASQPGVERCEVVPYPMFRDGGIVRAAPSGPDAVFGHVITVAETRAAMARIDAMLGPLSQGRESGADAAARLS